MQIIQKKEKMKKKKFVINIRERLNIKYNIKFNINIKYIYFRLYL